MPSWCMYPPRQCPNPAAMSQADLLICQQRFLILIAGYYDRMAFGHQCRTVGSGGLNRVGTSGRVNGCDNWQPRFGRLHHYFTRCKPRRTGPDTDAAPDSANSAGPECQKLRSNAVAAPAYGCRLLSYAGFRESGRGQATARRYLVPQRVSLRTMA
jgi:hypothetical protein